LAVARPWAVSSGAEPAVSAVEQDALRRGAAEFVGTFALVFVGAGSVAVSPVAETGLAALAYEWLYLRPLAPVPVGPAETGLEEPRPGDTA
jgi:hypothetical protein